ncbi:hypothetical protein MUK42_01195 [Musa troglodytarum]|uniref:Mediator complex subunit 15 KIX domain-containing protein n=1 Tax=Musa troglodytarum TaxID=320322 RepID=A0A9E7JGY1_9LILI|nr:hypothetical protein MUK42_01195 [Musa troglodytarum]
MGALSTGGPNSSPRRGIGSMVTLKRHLPISGPESLNELQKIAIRFEEKIYTAAANQSDYLRKISLKMLSMESKSQHSASINPPMSNSTIANQNPADSDGQQVP